MVLHGNFAQVGTDTRFVPHNMFTLVFAGSEHRVSFERQDSNAVLRWVSGANESRRVYLDTPIHSVWLAEDSIFYGDSSVGDLHLNGHTAKFMGNLENLRNMGMGNVYVDGDLISTQLTGIGYAGTMIVNGSVYLHTSLWLANANSRLSIRGNLYNGMDPSVVSTIVLSNGALLDLKGDYIQGHGLNNAGFVTTFNARVQLVGQLIAKDSFSCRRESTF